MCIPNDDTLNYPFCRLKLMVETNQTSLKALKLLSQGIRKRYYKTLGTSVMNSALSPLPICLFCYLTIAALLMDKIVRVCIIPREGGDIGLLITLVPEVLY